MSQVHLNTDMSGAILHIVIAYGFAVALLILLIREIALRRITERECSIRIERAEMDAIMYVQMRRAA